MNDSNIDDVIIIQVIYLRQASQSLQLTSFFLALFRPTRCLGSGLTSLTPTGAVGTIFWVTTVTALSAGGTTFSSFVRVSEKLSRLVELAVVASDTSVSSCCALRGVSDTEIFSTRRKQLVA